MVKRISFMSVEQFEDFNERSKKYITSEMTEHYLGNLFKVFMHRMKEKRKLERNVTFENIREEAKEIDKEKAELDKLTSEIKLEDDKVSLDDLAEKATGIKGCKMYNGVPPIPNEKVNNSVIFPKAVIMPIPNVKVNNPVIFPKAVIMPIIPVMPLKAHVNIPEPVTDEEEQESDSEHIEEDEGDYVYISKDDILKQILIKENEFIPFNDDKARAKKYRSLYPLRKYVLNKYLTALNKDVKNHLPTGSKVSSRYN